MLKYIGSYIQSIVDTIANVGYRYSRKTWERRISDLMDRLDCIKMQPNITICANIYQIVEMDGFYYPRKKEGDEWCTSWNGYEFYYKEEAMTFVLERMYNTIKASIYENKVASVLVDDFPDAHTLSPKEIQKKVKNN